MTGISDGMVLSIRLLLQQYSSQAFARDIRFQQEGFAEVGKGQDGSLKARGYEALKSLAGLLWLVKMF